MTETIWIAIGIIAAIILIILLVTVYTINISRKQKELLLSSLNDTLKTNHLHADKTEYFRNRVVALDVRNAALVYITVDDDGYRAEVHDLSDVKYCAVMNAGNKTTTTSRSGKKTSEEHINEIRLELEGPGQRSAGIVFYSEINDGLSELLDNKKKAETWQLIINNIIKNGG